MKRNQAAVLVLGGVLAVIGPLLWRVGRRQADDARAAGTSLSLRINLRATQVIGGFLLVLGLGLMAGAVIGALFWPRS